MEMGRQCITTARQEVNIKGDIMEWACGQVSQGKVVNKVARRNSEVDWPFLVSGNHCRRPSGSYFITKNLRLKFKSQMLLHY